MIMPLIRKPSPATTVPAPATDVRARLRDPDAEERWSAVRQLGGKPGSAALLAEALAQEGDPRVREAIFTALAQDGGRGAVATIVLFLRSPEAALRTGALDAFATLPEAIANNIAELFADPDPDIRILSCDLARSLPAAEATSHLIALLNRENMVNVCAAAVEVLSEVGTEQAIPALRACAVRFADDSFLLFAVDLAIQSLGEGGRPVPPVSLA